MGKNMIDREKATQIYFSDHGLPESGPTYKDTLEMHSVFTERISYLYSELLDLEMKDRALFQLKLTELYLLLRETNNLASEFEKKIEKIIEFHNGRGFMKHPRNEYDCSKKRVSFLMKYME
jgi:hypothetical protein